MFRGFATINYWAADLAAARDWYSKLLGIEPYFARAELDGRIIGPDDPDYSGLASGTSSSASATTSTSWD